MISRLLCFLSLFNLIVLDAFCPIAKEQVQKEDGTTESKFYRHCRPYTGQSVGRCQIGGKGQADCPHTGEVHDRRLQCVTGTHEDTIADDGRCKHRFCESLDAQRLGTNGDDLLHGSQQ